MIFRSSPPDVDNARVRIRAAYRADEATAVRALLAEARLPEAQRARIRERARDLVETIRAARHRHPGIDVFLTEYGLSTEEGIRLMCLAEALLRIPDTETADKLIRDKLGGADWKKHLAHAHSPFVNASTWALMLTGKLVDLTRGQDDDPLEFLGRLVARSGEPVIRQAIRAAMKLMGRQFVMGQTIQDGLERARAFAAKGYRASFDMLGEAALTRHDAERYFRAYDDAIVAVGKTANGHGPVAGHGISVKLSALHPRYEMAQRERVVRELSPRLLALARRARDFGIGLTIDAEEADRLELSLDVFEAVYGDSALDDWDGLGLVVQAYQKRAIHVLDWLSELAARHRRRIMVRLVKGAYWDTEIKRAQVKGLDGYPVFTRKAATDVSYLACVKRLFAAGATLYPQFATHNAYTLAAVMEIAGNNRDFEFQRLHGMGEELYEQVIDPKVCGYPCRIYAPVGTHEDLLPYLVRRLLENGANSSFVHRIVDERVPVEDLIADPVDILERVEPKPHPAIPQPADLYGAARRNSRGIDLSDPVELAALAEAMARFADASWRAAPIVGGIRSESGPGATVTEPADRRRVVGVVVDATETDLDRALDLATRGAQDWDSAGAETRARCLTHAADLFEAHRAELMALAVREAGKTIPNALGEVREAVDFLRYYAERARADFGSPRLLSGPTGEKNEITLHGRGVFACISPWNFPLAIFTGQVAAALAAGNAVIAKPAEQTPLIAARAVELLLEAGVPAETLHLLPGPGHTLGAHLVADRRIKGVTFTGSTETANAINRTLAGRGAPLTPLIAETGGQNALIADSSALPEQLVADAVVSAFDSAGQRCSALRVLFVQDDIAPKVLAMLAGAMAELRVGDPACLETDVGPVIDADALTMLDAHAQRMAKEATLIGRVALPDGIAHGTFCTPQAYQIDSIARLTREVFGPILHVVRYKADKLDAVIDAINATGYGLTLGVHSRIDETIERVRARARVGNLYVNRTIIGAVVGTQPFGGEGLSGTGPKAGGPHYLHRFATERVASVNIAASGGNTALLSLTDS
jgi:RHH-type proline utilization regulon transcriptional repressor/proline dehydrogenase/delta 1-pyrroline-5-carboxylate dehydrogenase